MFEPIRRRLLWSYLAVLAGVLICFSLAVRVVFIRSLTQKQVDELTLLAKAAATTANFGEGNITLTEAFAAGKLTALNQGIQWFNRRGQLIGQSGKVVVSLPLNFSSSIQAQTAGGPQGERLLAVTLAVVNEQTGTVTGFVRASQSLTPLEASIERLDWGLATGSLVALILSGMGGVWLTRQSMKPIEGSFERLKQFTADASHELRSPLMAIKSNASVALKYPEGMRPSDGEKFRAIASASQQMTRLTEDLLFLARTERLPSHAMKPVEITALVHELHRLYEPEAIAKGLCLQVNCPKPLTIQGDEAQLHRLLTNLLTNALRYTQEGGVTLSAQRNNKGALVKVEDTGIGIPVDQIPKVFDRFWQASDVRQYNSEGFGLGLAIAQAIVRHHQGSLTVTSRVGVGSCFAVQLPVSRTTKVT